MSALLQADAVSRQFTVRAGMFRPRATLHAVNGVDLAVDRGAVLGIVGESGCGKSTLARMLLGLTPPTEGSIRLEGQDIRKMDRRALARRVQPIFQDPYSSLNPRRSIASIVSLPLEVHGIPNPKMHKAIDMLERVGLPPRLAHNTPGQLSGGQRQRVALARSLVKRPKLLLLDEPLGALDKRLREQTQFELVNLQEKLGVTFIVVTHDQEEAMTMSSRIAVMNHGVIAQTGTPTEIYEYPQSRFVAEFIGSVNMFEGRVVEDQSDHVLIRSEDAGCDLYINHAVSVPSGATVAVAVRPEKIALSKEPPPNADGRNLATGTVREIAYLGDVSIYLVELASGKTVRVTAPNLVRRAEMPITWDDQVYLTWRPFVGVVLTQ